MEKPKKDRIILAGSDKGNLEKELQHMVISAKFIKNGYEIDIEEFTREELLEDLNEFRNTLEGQIKPIVKRLEEDMSVSSKALLYARELLSLYEDLVFIIEERLKALWKLGFFRLLLLYKELCPP